MPLVVTIVLVLAFSSYISILNMVFSRVNTWSLLEEITIKYLWIKTSDKRNIPSLLFDNFIYHKSRSLIGLRYLTIDTYYSTPNILKKQLI